MVVDAIILKCILKIWYRTGLDCVSGQELVACSCVSAFSFRKRHGISSPVAQLPSSKQRLYSMEFVGINSEKTGSVSRERESKILYFSHTEYSVNLPYTLFLFLNINNIIQHFFLCFSDRASQYRLFSSYQLNAHFLYSITIYMLHYNPQCVSSSTLLIFRRTNCIITASGTVTLCKQPYSMPVESGLRGVHSQPAYCTAVYRE